MILLSKEERIQVADEPVQAVTVPDLKFYFEIITFLLMDFPAVNTWIM